MYDNFTECYLGLAQEIYYSPDFTVSPRGLEVKEKLGVCFKIKDPRNRIPFVPKRKFSISYMIAELLWYVSGNNSTEWISYYSSFWKKISDDGMTANSAYGARIFVPNKAIANSEFSQWDYVKEELHNDPDSRRAVIHIRVPQDSISAKLDVPCTLALQFFIRDQKLHMITHMRSSDLILGIAYDIPAFTFFQELLALELGVGLGEYIHFSNSLHIYQRHYKMVESFLQTDEVENAKLLAISRGPMKRMSNIPPVRELLLFEMVIRKSTHYGEIMEFLDEFTTIENNNLNYWMDWSKILGYDRLKKLGFGVEANEVLNSASYVGYHELKRKRL